jgi:cell division transport system permease protein
MRISYLIRRTFEQVFRKWRANLILVVCLVLPFLVLDAFMVITANLWSLSQKLKEDVEVEVFLQDDINPDQTRSLRKYLLNQTEVEKVTYRSRAEAFAEMEDYLGEKNLGGLDSTTFPASLKVGVRQEYKNSKHISSLAGRIVKEVGVEDVEFGEEWLTGLDKAIKIFLTGDLIFGALVALSVTLMVSNFMRTAILSQTKAIRVMNLLGASWRDIYLPWLGQGMILAGLAALSGAGLVWTACAIFPFKSINLTFLPFYGTLGLTIWGVILGGGGSYWSVKRQM